MMNHPNIAKAHDGGVTETGRPFFVMELVRGNRITDYCAQHSLSTRQRLDLFTRQRETKPMVQPDEEAKRGFRALPSQRRVRAKP